ncbi:hypothetical protein [Corynebacterium glyciniphilum]|uniref:hypothetical protein n=1 Tax=Corynebacterium glyciniphilum TaxID=1404244 RepID=UPI003FCF50C7
MTMGGREADGDKIQWSRLNQPWFDRIVETLLLRKFRGVATVDIVDGRGGDEGIDVAVTYPDDTVVIYQLKYFPEGMSGNFSGRRRQVKDSFLQAANHHEPHKWVLVAPRNYTNAEKSFVLELADATPEGKRRPIVSCMGQAELDQMLIDYPEVDRWLTLDHYRRGRQIFEQERAAFLETVARDLADRVGSLGDVVDARDPDWTWDFARDRGTMIQTLRAKHDNAAQRSPISIRFTTALETDSPAEREFRQSIEYGSPTRVELPGTAVTDFDVSGSPIVQGIPEPDRLVIESLPIEAAPAVGMLMEIRFIQDGEVAATREGSVTGIHHGTHGFTSMMSFCGNRLTLTVRTPYQQSPDPTSMDIGYDISGLSPRAAADLLQAVLGLHLSDEIQLYLDGHLMSRYNCSGDATDSDRSDLEEKLTIYRFADDLAKVIAHTGQGMTFPGSFSVNDQVNARVARLLIGNHIVASPLARGFKIGLSTDAALTPQLRGILTQRHRIHWPAGTYTAPIAGREFELGQATAFHPEAWVQNGTLALTALEKGDAISDELILRPGDDPYFFVYLQSDETAKAADRRIANWGIDDIEEPWLDRPWLTQSQ